MGALGMLLWATIAGGAMAREALPEELLQAAR